MQIRYVSGILLTALITGCAVRPTDYTPRDNPFGNRYGYSEKRINDMEFAIIAEGNPSSSPEHVAKLALYHAANVTLRQGMQWFRIVKKSDETLSAHRLVSFPLVGMPTLFIPIAETPTHETTSILIIELCATSGSYECLNAKTVAEQLRPEIEKD